MPNQTIEIFGRKDCVWCKRATDEAFKHNVPYTYKDVHADLTDEEFVDLLGTRAVGARTVPIVLVDGEWIGGYSELKKLLFEDKVVRND